ncbi:SOS response-associated peptidase family protein [uncultured Psychrosphaera sp.]|uniref:SOS response-associated peptidase family protein n=1 Tax=uncultured Psychrosphaera sp. TaxID=1403522 RepID=UPI0030FB72C9
MCGRLNLNYSNGLEKLYQQLNINFYAAPVINQRFVRATDQVSIVHETVKDGTIQRCVENATWWLLLDKTDTGFKPSKYTSFNTRYDKLNTPRTAGFIPFRESRCIIPATGFGETEFVNKKPIHYYDMTAMEGEAIAFGGLYRTWTHPQTGQTTTSCSVITLPPHDNLKHIHSKAMPLILPQNDNTIDMWLDSSFSNVEVFNDLLTPKLPQSLVAQQIDKPSLYNGISSQQLINQDTTLSYHL